MPAATAIPAIIGGVSGLATAGSGIAQAIGAGKEAKRAREAIDNYQRQTLTNPYGGLQVSTLGADRMREDLARTVATMTEQAALGGIKGVASLAPNIVQQQNAQEAQIAANLDEQEKQRQQMIAQGNAMVQQMTEQRENNDLLGLGQQLSVAQQNKANGWNTFAQGMAGLGSAASAGLFDGLQFGGKNPSAIKVPGVNMNPIFNNPTFKFPDLSNIQIPKIG
ncbi:hypothetical protein [Epilithonimonas sp.]|uniref:hypothetical protein n=1 Tax=Epilithonimonas sp. TaxID=2894511 RepID=UPI0035B1F2A4